MSDGVKTMGGGAATVDVAQVLQQASFTRFHLWVLILTSVVTFFDGLDFLLIAYTLPYIRDEMGLDAAMMGYVSAAAFVGQMIGALVGSYLADLFGRRPVILVCTLLSAVLTFVTGLATDPWVLMLLRLVAGLAIGGLLAPAWSLNVELMPRSMRATAVTIVMLGFSLGASASGWVTNVIAPSFGWHYVFFFCGAVTFVLAGVLYFTLPESLRWMVARSRPKSRIMPVLRRISTAPALEEADGFYLSDETSNAVRQSPVTMFRALFRGWLAYITPLVWLAYFFSSFAMYLKTSFSVLFLEELGMSVPDATWLGSITTLLGAIGGVVLLAFTERRGPGWITLAPLIGIPFALLIGSGVALDTAFFIPAIAITAILTGTGHAAVISITSIYYPSAIRATGGGWASFMAKFASVAAPIAGAHLFLGSEEKVLHSYIATSGCLAGVIVCLLVLTIYAKRLEELRLAPG